MTSPRLALRAIRLTLTKTYSDPTPDYDAASADYDAFFSRVMGRHAIEMLEAVDIQPGDDVVELACGTGHLSDEIARRLGGRGTFRAVDKSPGMLVVAHGKLARFPDLDVELEQGDMLEFMRELPTSSADVVVCGWAICYTRPRRLLDEVARVLRPGGRIAVIETRADALEELAHALERVFAADPSMMRSLIRMSLPQSAQQVRRWCVKAGLVPTLDLEGEQVLPCSTPEAALEWVERSGAAAGFRDSMTVSRETEVRGRLSRELELFAERRGGLELRHTFVIVIARAPAVAGAATLTGAGG